MLGVIGDNKRSKHLARHSHTRANGDILRYNTRTNEFAVGAQDGTIRTLFRPKDRLNYWNKEVGQ